MKKQLLILIIMYCLSSCDWNDKDNTNLEYQILSNIEVPLKGKVQYNHSQIQLKDSCNFIGLDRDFQRLDIFSICDSTFKKSLIFSKDGPDKIFPISSFYYHSADSIFLFSLEALSFQLINEGAQLLDEWQLTDNLFPKEISSEIIGGTNYFYPFSLTQMGMFNLPFKYDASKEQLIFNIMAQSSLKGFQDRQTFYTAPLMTTFSIRDNKFQTFDGIWPEIYHHTRTPNNPFNNLAFNLTKNDVIINYYNSDLVFSSLNDQFYEVKSNYFKKDFTSFKIKGDVNYSTEEELIAFHNDEGYVNLVQDPYKKLYYRIAKHANKRNGDDNIHRMESAWSIIVFNEQFEILGEVLMPEKTYNFLQILPTSKGLLISKENPYSPTNIEEVYEFDLIEIDL